MHNLTPEQQKECQNRIDIANAEIKAICEKYQVEPIVTNIELAMGDLKYKGIPSPFTNPDEPIKEA